MAPGFTCMISARHWLPLVLSEHSSSVSIQNFLCFCDGTERLFQMAIIVCRSQTLRFFVASCSFFVLTVGDCIYTADQAKRVKYAYDKGHQVASHTWAHKNLTTLNWDQSKLPFPFGCEFDLLTSVFCQFTTRCGWLKRPSSKSLEPILHLCDPVSGSSGSPSRILTDEPTAYGEHNGMVRDAARVRGQTIALWDFE